LTPNQVRGLGGDAPFLPAMCGVNRMQQSNLHSL
jgi:hypothetical protein